MMWPARRVRVALRCLLLACLAGAATPCHAQELDKLRPFFNLRIPSGHGPFPAVILVSSGRGFGPRYDPIQADLTALGFVTIRADYLAARAKSDSSQVYLKDGAQDVKAIARHLKARTFVKSGSINVLGWSAGAAMALAALAPSVRAPVNRVVAYYPNCKFVKAWKVDIPVLILAGQRDAVAPVGRCQSVLSKMGYPKTVALRVLANAQHGFDAQGSKNYQRLIASHAWQATVQHLKK